MDTVTARNVATGETVAVERDCAITFHGQRFEANGAVVAPDFAVAYMAPDMASVTDWHGNRLGSARVITSWPMPHSFVSSRQYQVEARINGRLYTGRTMGSGMLWRGKAKKESK